jgi:hypothetical protein
LIVALLHFEGPLFVDFVGLGLLLFVLFHCEDVVEQPLKDDRVAVNADINFVVVADLFEAAVEVLHILDQQTAAEGEVALFLLAVIDYVNHDAVFEVRPIKQLEALLVGARRHTYAIRWNNLTRARPQICMPRLVHYTAVRRVRGRRRLTHPRGVHLAAGETAVVA